MLIYFANLIFFQIQLCFLPIVTQSMLLLDLEGCGLTFLVSWEVMVVEDYLLAILVL